MDLCYPHLMLGTSETDYNDKLKSRMRSYESEELETNEMDDDVFSVRGDINDIVDDGVSFSEEPITPCALNYEEDGRSHLMRLDKQTKSFLSHQTQRLHQDLENNSAERLCMPTMASLNQSRKNMLENIDYVKTYCNVENNPRVARIWAEKEHYLEMKQNEARDILTEETRVHSQEIQGRILMLGIRMKKKRRRRD
jgi:hypothetical protein